MYNERIMMCCKQLRLSSTFAENAINIDAESNQEYLVKILETEVLYRDQKRKNLNIKKACFDNIKTFEGFEFEGIQLPTGLDDSLFKSVDFIENKQNLILYGKSGAGK